MRAGLLIGQTTEVVPCERLLYSSTYDNFPKCTGHAQGMLDAGAWCAASNDLNQWIRMDVGQVKVINGVVTQGKPDTEQRVTSYFIETSSDGNTWTTVSAASAGKWDSLGSYLSYSDGLDSANTLPAPDEWTVVCATSRADSPVLVNGIERSRSC